MGALEAAVVGAAGGAAAGAVVGLGGLVGAGLGAAVGAGGATSPPHAARTAPTARGAPAPTKTRRVADAVHRAGCLKSMCLASLIFAGRRVRQRAFLSLHVGSDCFTARVR